jgi:hypothetical protein
VCAVVVEHVLLQTSALALLDGLEPTVSWRSAMALMQIIQVYVPLTVHAMHQMFAHVLLDMGTPTAPPQYVLESSLLIHLFVPMDVGFVLHPTLAHVFRVGLG